MSVSGVVSNGVVVLPKGVSFPEGTQVDVIPRGTTPKSEPISQVTLHPRDEWERRLLAIATDCGVSLSNESLGREEMYD